MTSRKPLTAADFIGTNGRHVRICGKGVIDDRNPESSGVVSVRLSNTLAYSVPRRLIVEILPEVIEVGDTVQHVNGARGVVKAADDGHLAVAVTHPMTPGPYRSWWPATDCTLVEKAKP